MTAIKFAKKKSKTFMRKVSTFFAFSLGLFAIFFVSTPKILTHQNSDQATANFFTENAYADIPNSGDGGGDSGVGGDAATDGGVGGVDSVGDSVGGGQGDGSGGCGDDGSAVA